jgi:arylsulfatase
MPEYPNILWLMTDEQRLDSLSYTGSPWAQTPNLDAIAGSGIRFLSAYTPSPVCVSARVSLLTGRYASSTGVLSNHHQLNLGDPHFLTTVFSENGYQVASFGKHHYNCSQQAFDFEYNYVLGDKVHYYNYRDSADAVNADVVRYDGGKSPWLLAGRFPGSVDDTPEMHTVKKALEWMKRCDPDEPFFMRISFNAPHTPVVTPAPFDTLIQQDCITLPIDWSQNMAFVSDTHRDYLCDYAGTHRLSSDQIRRARQCYYGYVACTDAIFGRILDELNGMGVMDNTIVVFTSDHGTHLGDQGFFQKQSFWDVSVKVPFFFSGPGIRAGTVNIPVNTGSMLPTLLDLAGLSVPKHVQFPSLCETLQKGTPPERTPVFSEIDYGIWDYRSGERYVMVRDGRYKMMLYREPRDSIKYKGTDDRVLFDLASDPHERKNLASLPELVKVQDILTAKIDDWDNSRDIVEPTLVVHE